MNEKWLEWAKELQFLAQAGLTYSKDCYDIERFERIREIAAEMVAYKTEIPLNKVKDLFCNETGFQTPKIDTRAAIFKENKILLVNIHHQLIRSPKPCIRYVAPLAVCCILLAGVYSDYKNIQ